MAMTTYGSIEDSTTATTAAGIIDPEVETADAAPLVDDSLFDADQTYYLKNGHHNSQWTAQRIWNLLLPLIFAALLIGGAAMFLLRDFSHLYPGEGGGSTTDTSGSIPTTTTNIERSSYQKPTTSERDSSHSTTTTTSRSSGSSDSSSSSNKNNEKHHSTFVPPNDGASCSLHPDCSLLIGNCCPTVDGKHLECCSI